MIREGDQYRKPNSATVKRAWATVRAADGDKVGSWPQFQWRRPRSTVIRDAATSLLATIEAEMQSDFPQLSDEILAAAADLKRVMGGDK